MPIKHAVWSTPAPPVCTAMWSQKSWDNYAKGYRPKGYEGGMHDQVAYNRYLAERDIQQSIAYLAGANDTPTASPMDITRHAHVGHQCGCGECYACFVYELSGTKFLLED